MMILKMNLILEIFLVYVNYFLVYVGLIYKVIMDMMVDQEGERLTT